MNNIDPSVYMNREVSPQDILSMHSHGVNMNTIMVDISYIPKYNLTETEYRLFVEIFITSISKQDQFKFVIDNMPNIEILNYYKNNLNALYLNTNNILRSLNVNIDNNISVLGWDRLNRNILYLVGIKDIR